MRTVIDNMQDFVLALAYRDFNPLCVEVLGLEAPVTTTPPSASQLTSPRPNNVANLHCKIPRRKP